MCLVDVFGGCVLPRYFVDDNWQPKKMDVEVEVPLTLDLESFRSSGMQVRRRCCYCVGVLVVMPCCVGAALVHRDPVLWWSCDGVL